MNDTQGFTFGNEKYYYGALKATMMVKNKQNFRYLHYQETSRVDMGVKISGKANTIQAKRFGAGLFTLR